MKKMAKLTLALLLLVATSSISNAQANLFREVSPQEIEGNIIKKFQEDWFLLTAGNKAKFNPMTISWGTMGSLWNKPVVTVYVRTDRYTFTLMENSKYFTLCALGPNDKSILQYCGTRSGRNVNKIKESGLKPIFSNTGAVYYEQAVLVIECKKIYAQKINLKKFTDPFFAPKIYHDKSPLHKMYIGEIVRCYVKK